MVKFLKIFVVFVTSLCYAYTYSPVIIIPGAAGSRLEAKLSGKPRKPAFYCYSKTNSYFTLWLELKALLPLSTKCWVDNIRLQWDMKNMVARNVPGVITRTPGFGDTYSVETLDNFGLVKYLQPLVKNIVQLGYKRGKDVRAAPYDFRFSPEKLPDNYHAKLKKLIEETYTMNGYKKVTLISHSYGCPVTLYFLSLQTKDWKKQYIKQWVALSGVFGGTIQEVLVYGSGYLEGIPDFLVNRLAVRSEQRSSTSNLFMLPSLSLWPADDVIVSTKKRDYRLSHLDEFLSDIGFPEGTKMRRHIVNSTYLMHTSPGVPIYCFHGNKPNSTVRKLIYGKNFPDNFPTLVKGDGDASVNIESLRLCNQFKSRQKETVTSQELHDVTHNGVLGNEVVFNMLKKIL